MFVDFFRVNNFILYCLFYILICIFLFLMGIFNSNLKFFFHIFVIYFMFYVFFLIFLVENFLNVDNFLKLNYSNKIIHIEIKMVKILK